MVKSVAFTLPVVFTFLAASVFHKHTSAMSPGEEAGFKAFLSFIALLSWFACPQIYLSARSVRTDEKNLYISKFSGEFCVPITNVRDIQVLTLQGRAPDVIKIYFEDETLLGHMIKFIPAGSTKDVETVIRRLCYDQSPAYRKFRKL